MTRTPIALLATLVATLFVAAEASAAQEGQKEFQRCAECHAIPDSSIRADKLWTEMINGSAWVGAPGNRELLATRKAIIDYLRSDKAKKLEKVDGKTPVATGSAGFAANIEDGYVLLAPKEGSLGEGVRVVFTKGDTAPRSVPMGEYVVRRTVVNRTDDKGVAWSLWATGIGQAVTVGRTGAKLELDPDVTFKATIKRGPKGVMAGGSFCSDSGMGASVVKENARILPTWSTGTETGECAYGWGGGFCGSWKGTPAKGQKVSVLFDAGPFKVKGDPREKVFE